MFNFLDRFNQKKLFWLATSTLFIVLVFGFFKDFENPSIIEIVFFTLSIFVGSAFGIVVLLGALAIIETLLAPILKWLKK